MPIGIKVELWREADIGDAYLPAVFKQVTGHWYSTLACITVESPSIFAFPIFNN